MFDDFVSAPRATLERLIKKEACRKKCIQESMKLGCIEAARFADEKADMGDDGVNENN